VRLRHQFASEKERPPKPVARKRVSRIMRAVKVLFDHDVPFLFSHGGFQIQIEQTLEAVRANGVEVEPVRWWEDRQRGDLVHYFGRPTAGYFKLAKTKGLRVVLLPLLSTVGSRSAPRLCFQSLLFGLSRRALTQSMMARLSWDCFLDADACIANTKLEARLMTYIYGTPAERVHVVPNGIEDIFSKSQPAVRGKWLVCTATITERKRALETAQAAVLAKTPLWIIGKPYSDTDPYGRRFVQFAKQNPDLLRFEGPIDDRTMLARAYREARGFVLLSMAETLSLSSFEAAACECPLLLSDLPWAEETFKDRARYCPIASPVKTAAYLRKFYDDAPMLPPPPKPQSWVEVGAMFKRVYEIALSASR
jgi:glycosyltransferase involved in cell wall biosynthesis